MELKMAGLMSPGFLNPTQLHSPNQSNSVFDFQKQKNTSPGRGLSILA
jgi:hypothetical protein